MLTRPPLAASWQPLAAPELGGRASSGCAWRLWAVRYFQGRGRGEAGPLVARPLPRVPEPAASKSRIRPPLAHAGDNMFRFDYSPAFLRWALSPPGFKPEWHVGVRVTQTQKLVAFISCTPALLYCKGVRVQPKPPQLLNGVASSSASAGGGEGSSSAGASSGSGGGGEVPPNGDGEPVDLDDAANTTVDGDMSTVEVNFLCVHKKLRSKRLAPVGINEDHGPHHRVLTPSQALTLTRCSSRRSLAAATSAASFRPRTRRASCSPSRSRAVGTTTARSTPRSSSRLASRASRLA